MAWTISVICLSVWLVGVSAPTTLHGYIHILLALAIGANVISIVSRTNRSLD